MIRRLIAGIGSLDDADDFDRQRRRVGRFEQARDADDRIVNLRGGDRRLLRYQIFRDPRAGNSRGRTRP